MIILKKKYGLFYEGKRYAEGECTRKDLNKALNAYGQGGDLGLSIWCVYYNNLKDNMKKAKEAREEYERGGSCWSVYKKYEE